MRYKPKHEKPKMNLWKFWYVKDNIEFGILHATKTSDIKEIFLEAFSKGSKLDAKLIKIDELYTWRTEEIMKKPIPELSAYGREHAYGE